MTHGEECATNTIGRKFAILSLCASFWGINVTLLLPFLLLKYLKLIRSWLLSDTDGKHCCKAASWKGLYVLVIKKTSIKFDRKASLCVANLLAVNSSAPSVPFSQGCVCLACLHIFFT